MAHKTLVNGTAYEISGGRTLVNGTGYSIAKGRTLVNGTGYDVTFVEMVKVTVKTVFEGMSGDTASITVISPEPFTPDPSNQNNTITSWTVAVYDEPNCTIEIPVGSTIECTVSRDKGNADSHISVNGTRVLTGEGTYIYTVIGDATITITEKYTQGEYGIITIIEN